MNNWNFGVECNFYRFSTGSLSTLTSAGILTTVSDIDVDIHTVVARLNYKFGWVP